MSYGDDDASVPESLEGRLKSLFLQGGSQALNPFL